MAITRGTVVGGQASGGDITTSLVISSGQTVIIAICTTQDSNTNNIGVGSITRNSQTFTKIVGYGGSGGTGQPLYAEAWYLINPTVGTYNSVAHFNGTINNCSVTYYPLSGADTADLVNTTSSVGSGNGFANYMDLTTDADNCEILGALVSEQTINSVEYGSSDASYVDQSYENTNVAHLDTTTAGLYTLGFNMAGGGAWGEVAVAINPLSTTTIRVGSFLTMFR
jgi:hypothetical protein